MTTDRDIGVAAHMQHPAREVQVWLAVASLVDDGMRAACEALLDASEHERARRFRVDHAREQFVVGRALLRLALSWHAGVAPRAWVFGANAHGKPHVADPAAWRALQFNVSHTEGLVVCAIGGDAEIGVDVENAQRRLNLDGLASQLFAPAERVSFDRMDRGAQRDYFFATWTLKEAYVKARGLGLSLPLDGFLFEAGEAGIRAKFLDHCPDDPSRWQFAQAQPTAQHRLALAAVSAWPLRPRLRWATPRMFMPNAGR